MKSNYTGSFFPNIVTSPNSEAQWVRGFTTNLLVMSWNPARSLTIFTFPNIFKAIFWQRIIKLLNSKPVKIL